MNNVVFLSVKEDVPADSYWDQQLLKDLLSDCRKSYSVDGLEEAIVIIPGAYQSDVIDKINAQLAKLKKCKVIVTSDEENKFPLEELKHPNMELYATYAYKASVPVKWLPIGYPSHLINMPHKVPDKQLDVFYSGQLNHDRRKIMFETIKDWNKSYVEGTEGFAQGLNPIEYYQLMSRAKVVPAPRGNVSPDSFRLYEALENGCVPIAEYPNFWNWLFTSVPFPVIEKPEQWKGYIEDALKQYPRLNNRCQSWWVQQKQAIKKELTGEQDDITVVIPVSTIPSHPDTKILEETINSVLFWLPNSQIIVTFDGIRKEQEDRRADYEEHIRRFLWVYKDSINILPIIFDDHIHQVGMMREVIDSIKSPLILYVEQDTPLVTDEHIEWDKVNKKILSGESNLVRFHFEAVIPKEHEYLMIGDPEEGFLKTAQWSQRPHVASTAFYKRILSENFSKKAKCFIEDLIHGHVLEDCKKFGEQGWNQWRIHIYYPEGGNIKRSLNLDGRAGTKKYDEDQVW